jgi:hypothetical protein
LYIIVIFIHMYIFVRLHRRGILRTVAKDIFAAVDYKIAKEWKRRWADLERNILM